MQLLLLALLAVVDADTCVKVNKNSLKFCSMIDYSALLDDNDITGSISDDEAKAHYDNVDNILLRFGCSTTYSLYSCADCRDAYKYWVCASKFQKCGGLSQDLTALCPALDDPPPSCENYRARMCVSLCEDVIRKCPFALQFQCPDTETPYSSKNIATCNKLDRVVHPDEPDRPWPGTFATDSQNI